MDFNHLNYLKQVTRDLYRQYSEYPAGENIRFEITLGVTNERGSTSPDEMDYTIAAVKQLKDEGVILDYIVEEQTDDAYEYDVAKCLVDREKLAEHVRVLDLPRIFYDKETGVGEVDGKPFRIKTSTEEGKVLGVLFDQINTALPRAEVLRLVDFEERTEDPQHRKMDKSLATYRTTEIAKSIRKKTGLSTSNLINNGGTLTLKGLRLALPQNAPKDT